MRHLGGEAVLILDGEEIPLDSYEVVERTFIGVDHAIPGADYSAEFTIDLTPEAARRFTAFVRKATRKSAPRAMVTFSDGWVYDPFPRWLGRARRFESWREAARRTRRASKRWRGDALRWER